VKTADPLAEIQAIHAILEPAYGHVLVYGQPYQGLLTGHVPAPYTFEVAVLPSLEAPGMAWTAREVRAAFLKCAEDALDAVGAAGWHLTSYPRMEFTGDVERFKTDALSGKLFEPSRQYGIELKMRFEVDRPR
jgi:hypothetical protein